MIKKFLMILLVAGWLNAGFTNAVAVMVNDLAITMYDIDEIKNQENLSHKQAVSRLIDKILYKQEIKKFKITVMEDEVSDYINQLAKVNRMSLEDFKKIVKREKSNYNIFLEEVKIKILNRKLISQLVRGKLKIATDEDMMLFYDNNMEQFRADKGGIQIIPFVKVKDKIFNIIMSKREQHYVNKYFETLKITANIKIIR